MRTLYLDCAMGAAGDMLTAALLELMPDSEATLAKLNSLGVPTVTFQREASTKCGITGTHICVTVNGEEEDHIHEHGHHHHHHSSLHDISHIISHLAVSDTVKSHVLAVYNLIAEAESHVHGVPVTEIHFHEVGTMDALADITAVCQLMETLAPEQVIVSPVHVGCGMVRCAHGLLPVPAPATAYILKDVPIYGGRIRGELCTPTGAALLKHFATGFGEMPMMSTSSIGYGMGKKDFEAANCVRAFWGETADGGDTVLELQCNLDDMTPEAIGFAMERLLEAGALDVFTIPVGMKKNRPGIVLTALCKPEVRQKITEAIFRHTTTLGIREHTCRRHTLSRGFETLQTPHGSVTKKISTGHGVRREKYEYEDLARIARTLQISLREAQALVEDMS